jgi:(p)ppGpp synthase/HD superfamily hydrolase
MNNNVRCQAKNPSTCWRHGIGIGFNAHRAIKDVLSDHKPSVDEFTRRELKTYESEELASVMMSLAQKHPTMKSKRIREAMLLASDLHKTDTRANRAHHDRTPYIEHPLRNTIRIFRYGCEKEHIIIGSLLHDTVEDHPFEIAREYAKKEPANEAEAREISYSYIEKKFGKKVSNMVRGMSNPISEDKYAPAAVKNLEYSNHVAEAIEDPDVLIGKTSDFTDNALSLHHTEKGMTSISLYKKATKYLGVIDVLEARWKRAYHEGDVPVPKSTIEALIRQMQTGRQKLLEIQARHAPATA